MSKLSSASKVKAISQSCNETLSPASKSSLSQRLSNEADNPLVGIYQSVSKKRDKTSYCVRHLVLNKLATSAGSVEKAKKNLPKFKWDIFAASFSKGYYEIIIHYKTIKSKAQKPPTEAVKKILDFYNRDNISRQLPYKNLTRKIKGHLGVYHRVPVRVMEVTLKKAYDTFKVEFPNAKLNRSSFEKQRPKNIRLRPYAGFAVLLHLSYQYGLYQEDI